MRKWAIGLVLAGLCTIAFPHIQQAREDKQQRELLAELQVFAEAAEGQASENYAGAEVPPQGVPFEEGAHRPAGDASVEAPDPASTAPSEPASPTPAPSPVAKPLAAAAKPAAMGILEIPKIESKLPVLAGVTDVNMKLGAVHFKGTAVPGHKGNAVIAAHRSLSYGRLFNRLVELKSGDTIIVRTGGEKKEFTVTATEIVEPSDVSVLKQPASGVYLTLITCEPIDTGTHRFIVRAKMTEVS
ncbi:class D sortase [Paenibacillus puerhi]|uniref:class D sortase n=1 Tax=Paenibacillus puerhi TaxID=2692622 RepID=UPI001358ED5E|nr:class D sortase [Paenibacillus puerhi]